MATFSSGASGVSKTGSGFIRWLVALIVGLIGALFVWVATPYNNFIIANSYISDSYLPVASIFCITVIALVINPLIRFACPALALNFKQLTLIFAILLAASVTPSSGLLRMLPYSLANASVNARSDKRLADAYAALNPPTKLFPDKLVYGEETPVADPFIGELNPGESIPWRAWLPPLLSWNGFLIPFWLMMAALGVLVFPQWRDNERLPFPLLPVLQSFIDAPEPGKRLPPIFSRRAFLIGMVSVFALHMLTGLNAYMPGRAPVIPLSWDLTRFFSEEPLTYLPWHLKTSRIFFTFVGIAFFMPNRIGLSIWSFQIIYGLYIMIGSAYFPPFPGGAPADHSTGAFISTALVILWLGRAHWAHVMKCMFGRIANSDDRSYLFSGWAFVLGLAGMIAWLLWVRVPLPFALFLTTMAFIMALVMTRIIAESGLPMLAADSFATLRLLRLIPAATHTAASAFFGGIVSVLIGSCNRLCLSVFTTHAIGLDRETTQSKRMSMGGIMLLVVIASVVICGAVHLYFTYHHSATLNGMQSPIGNNWVGTQTFNWSANALLYEQQKGAMSVGNYHQIGHLLFGFFFALFLQYMCLNFTWWPLHPVALLFIGTWYATQVWVSVFLGWLAKVLILRYGGSRIYRSASPFFIGLVIGEVLAMTFWVLVSGIRGYAGLPYEIVEILPF